MSFVYHYTTIVVGPNGKMPTKGTPLSAGLDLYAAEDVKIHANSVNRIRTDIRVSIEKGYYGRIASRSGLAIKYGANVLAGVIDGDYRGEVIVLLTSFETFEVKKGDRVAQLIIEKYSLKEVEQVENFESETSRGEGGFGSTGN